MANSYNGWPASPDKGAIGVVSNQWFPGGAKAGDVTTVLGYVAREFNARVEPVVSGWCWGYTYKANANNPNQLSCHASGTALDVNAPDHPNGSGGTFTSAQRGAIYAILDECQGAVGWLEGYDEMHFEIQVSASDLATVAASLGGGGGGGTPPAPEPGPEPTPPPEDDMPRRIVTVYDGQLNAVALALDGPTGVVVLANPDEQACVEAVIDTDTAVNQAQIDVYNAVLARGNALTSS
jgi:hypothetical protein